MRGPDQSLTSSDSRPRPSISFARSVEKNGFFAMPGISQQNGLALTAATRILETRTARDVLYPVQLRVMRSLSGK